MYDGTHEVVVHGMDNGKNGHCWIHVVLQALALEGGLPLALVQSAFSQKGGDRLYNLNAAARRLTVAVLGSTKNGNICGLVAAMTGPEVGTDTDKIRRLALDYTKHIHNAADLRNTIEYMDPILGGGGHGGEAAILALAEGVGIVLHIGSEVQVWKEYIDGSTTKHMALLDENAGHWSLQVYMVSKKLVRF